MNKVMAKKSSLVPEDADHQLALDLISDKEVNSTATKPSGTMSVCHSNEFLLLLSPSHLVDPSPSEEDGVVELYSRNFVLQLPPPSSLLVQTTTGAAGGDWDDFLSLDTNSPPLLVYEPTSTFSLFLDERALSYLHYFQHNVTEILCIIPEETPNYFVRTFFSVAMTDEAILNALAAWGGYFKEGRITDAVSSHYKTAQDLMAERYAHRTTPLDKFDRYILVCFYVILIGVELCRGDASNWYSNFEKCHKILTSDYGGMLQLCQDFSYSNDVKWLVSNLQFHDIMSSDTQARGTLFPMDDYNTLFTKYRLLETGGYLDPFQGCVQPIYMVLAEVIDAHVRLKQKRQDIETKLTSTILSSQDMKTFRQQRLDYFIESEKTIRALQGKIDSCQPSESQLALFDADSLPHQLTFFETVRDTCKIYLLLHLKQLLPSSSEVQLILLPSLYSMETLEETNLITAMSMLLLIFGISCSLPCDRIEITNIYKRGIEIYKLGNMHRVWDVVQEFWNRNPHGNLCIDWADICEEKGWVISMC